MRTFWLLALLLAAAAAPARAQVPMAADNRADEALVEATAKPKKAREEPAAPVARALQLAFGATFFAEVQVSTNGAVVDLSRLSREGFYKLELIQLLMLSAKTRTPLAALADRRRKGEPLRDLAFKSGMDYDKLYDASLAVQEIVDRDYLPRFPQRRPRKERDEP